MSFIALNVAQSLTFLSLVLALASALVSFFLTLEFGVLTFLLALLFFLSCNATLLFLDSGFFVLELLAEFLSRVLSCLPVGSVFLVCLGPANAFSFGGLFANLVSSDDSNYFLDSVHVNELSYDARCLLVEA